MIYENSMFMFMVGWTGGIMFGILITVLCMLLSIEKILMRWKWIRLEKEEKKK